MWRLRRLRAARILTSFPAEGKVQMVIKSTLVVSFLVALLIVACSPEAASNTIARSSEPGPLVPVGEPEAVDLGPTIESVWNCGSGGGTVVKHPSRSVATNHAIEWEVGGTTGFGVKIGEGAIPGGVDLSTTMEGHYRTQLDQSGQQGTSWDLPAEPNTVVEYTLMWREKWQSGYIDILSPNQSNVRANVRYRTEIQSEIVGKRVQPCDGAQPVPDTPVFTAPVSQPMAQPSVTDPPLLPTKVMPIPTQAPSIELVNRDGAPANSSKPFEVSLGKGEIIVGQSYGFNQYKGGCAAFLITGSGQFEFTVTDGVWFQYNNVLSTEQAETLLQEQISYLTKNYPCTPAMVNISRLQQ